MANDLGPEINILVWLFTVPTIIIVLARFYCRFILKPNEGWDDLAIGIALLVDITYSIICTYGVSRGVGQHTTAVAMQNPAEVLVAGKWIVINASVAIWVYAIPKVAIALLLGRVFAVGHSVWHKFVLYVPLVVLMLWCVATFILWLTQCNPIAAIYNPALLPPTGTAKCLSPWVFVDDGIAYSAFSAFLDFLYAVYPVVAVARLQMDYRRKIGVSLMMGLGIGGGVAAIYKITKLPALATPTDPLYVDAPLYYATSIEANLIILAACVPTLSPLLKMIFGSNRRTGMNSTWRMWPTNRPSVLPLSSEHHWDQTGRRGKTENAESGRGSLELGLVDAAKSSHERLSKTDIYRQTEVTIEHGRT